MYTDSFDSLQAKQRALAVIHKQNATAAYGALSRFQRLLPRIFSRKPMTAFQESLVVHMYCAAPHSAME